MASCGDLFLFRSKHCMRTGVECEWHREVCFALKCSIIHQCHRCEWKTKRTVYGEEMGMQSKMKCQIQNICSQLQSTLSPSMVCPNNHFYKCISMQCTGTRASAKIPGSRVCNLCRLHSMEASPKTIERTVASASEWEKNGKNAARCTRCNMYKLRCR